MFYTDKRGREYYQHDNFRDYNLSPLRDLAYNRAAIADNYSDSAARARTDGQAGHTAALGFGGSGTKISADPGKNAAMEAGNMMQQAFRAMEQGLNQEAAAVQDRQMDLAENALATNAQTQRYKSFMDNDAMKYTADANRIPGFQGAGNVGNPLQGLYANAPNINIFDRNGNRIGGSYYNS